MNLLRYTIRRILGAIPVIFGVLFLTFVMTRFMPGNPFLFVIRDHMSSSQISWYYSAVERYGLNEPITIQFYRYFTNAMGLFWAWLIFLYIGGLIIFFTYKGIRLGYKKIHPKAKVA
ncbi:MAG: hypothetical protein ACTSWX_12195 [Promethearchaeota archaeon]